MGRYILLTGLTIDTPYDRKGLLTKFLTFLMKTNFRDIIADKQKDYNLLAQSSLDWTVVRVPMIEQTDSTRPLKVNLKDCPGNKISTTDLADFLIKQLSDPEFIGKAPFISN